MVQVDASRQLCIYKRVVHVARDRAKAKMRVKIGQAPHEEQWGGARGIQLHAPGDWEDMASAAAFGIE